MRFHGQKRFAWKVDKWNGANSRFKQSQQNRAEEVGTTGNNT